MKKAILTVLFTILVTVVFVAPISLVYLLTRERVALNEEVFLKRAVLSAAGIPVPPPTPMLLPRSPPGRRRSRPRRSRSTGSSPGRAGMRSRRRAGPPGTCSSARAPGCGARSRPRVGFDAALERLTGVDFLKQSETPGLGARIAEAWFKEQFRGKKGPFTTVGEGEPAAENQFDAITGATITSNAVMGILNGAIAAAPGLVN